MTAWLVLISAFLVMGGQFAVARRGLAEGLTAYDLVALRFAGAALPALAVLLWRGAPRLGGVGYGRAVILTLLAGSPYALLMYAALRFAPAAHGAMLIPGLGIVVATLLGAAWVGERHGPGRYAGVGVVIAGLIILGLGGGVPSAATATGDLMLVAAGVAWGVFTLLVRRWQLDALAATAAFSVLSLLYLPVYVLTLSPRVLDVAVEEVLLQAAYQGVLQTAFAFAGYAYAVRRLGAGTAAIGTAVIPVIGTLIAIPVAGEWPAAHGWVGLGAVCAGIAVANVTLLRRRSVAAQHGTVSARA